MYDMKILIILVLRGTAKKEYTETSLSGIDLSSSNVTTTHWPMVASQVAQAPPRRYGRHKNKRPDYDGDGLGKERKSMMIWACKLERNRVFCVMSSVFLSQFLCCQR